MLEDLAFQQGSAPTSTQKVGATARLFRIYHRSCDTHRPAANRATNITVRILLERCYMQVDIKSITWRYKYASAAEPQLRFESQLLRALSHIHGAVLPLLSANRAREITYHTYTRAYRSITSSLAPSGQCEKCVLIQRKVAPAGVLFFLGSAFSAGDIPIIPSIFALHPSDSVLKHTGVPSIGSARIIDISCRVTVISPVRRWKLCVSGLHRSTRAVMAAGFMLTVDRETRWMNGRSLSLLMYGVYLSSYGIFVGSDTSWDLRRSGFNTYNNKTILDNIFHYNKTYETIWTIYATFSPSVMMRARCLLSYNSSSSAILHICKK